MSEVKLTNIIAPAFYGLHNDIQTGGHVYYKLGGGRGSTKSSFISAEIILGMMADAEAGNLTSAVIFRRHKSDLHTSVFEQLAWAIDKLEVGNLWKQTINPMRMTYKPTRQVILFRGADDERKSKSIKVARGYIKYLWFEELDEFEGPEKIRTIQQSVIRGGENFRVFYSFNPPRTQRSWVNNPAQWQRADTVSHASDYRTVPREWIGDQFIADAEHLRAINETAYRHEYLGEVTGAGTEIFRNLTRRTITAEEIREFNNTRRGIDWGYSTDPFCYIACHLDKTRRRLYIYDEIYKIRLSNREAAKQVKQKNPENRFIFCDSAEPKSISEFKNEYNINIKGAKKRNGSIEYGIKYLSEELEEIIIDGDRAPHAWREFYEYELDTDANGELKAGYPDRNNHAIDATRYALADDMTPKSRARFVNVEL